MWIGPCVEFCKGAGSQSVVSVWNILWEARGSKAFYKAVAEAV